MLTVLPLIEGPDFTALFVVPFAIYLVLVLAGKVSLPAGKAKGAGRRLLGPFFVGGLYWMYGPAFRFLVRSFLAFGISARYFYSLLGRGLICIDGGCMSDAKITCTGDVLNRNFDHGLG